MAPSTKLDDMNLFVPEEEKVQKHESMVEHEDLVDKELELEMAELQEEEIMLKEQN